MNNILRFTWKLKAFPCTRTQDGNGPSQGIRQNLHVAKADDSADSTAKSLGNRLFGGKTAGYEFSQLSASFSGFLPLFLREHPFHKPISELPAQQERKPFDFQHIMPDSVNQCTTPSFQTFKPYCSRRNPVMRVMSTIFQSGTGRNICKKWL